jgi:phthalate 4,5-cis-dihydrodiol dehydrogenase
MAADCVRVGIAGLGKAARMKLGQFKTSRRVQLTAGADLRPEERERWKRLYGIETYPTVEAMCQQGAIDAVWIFLPHHLHAQYAVIAADHGKHVLVEKPMAVTMDEADRMVEAVERNGVRYIHAHAKIYLPPLPRIGELIASGRYGRVTGINAWYFNDWLCRPEWSTTDLDERKGGGPLYWIGAHHMDIVRYLGGGMVRSVRASMGRWKPGFDVPGNYAAFFEFENGVPAQLTLSTYGHFDTLEFTAGIGEGGTRRPDAKVFGPRLKNPRPLTPQEKYALDQYDDAWMEARVGSFDEQRFDHFGLTLLSLEHADIRQSPNGLFVYSENGKEELALQDLPPWGELVELAEAVLDGKPPLLDARWARASLETLIAIAQSAAERKEVYLSKQVPARYPKAAAAA